MSSPEAPPPVPPVKPSDKVLDRRSAIRYATHLAVLFLSFFLVIRTVGCEPFGVPTGSMAPALLGNHRECPCPRCGYPVVVGEATNDRRGPYGVAACTNCGQKKIDLSNTPDLPGDRLMVDKNVYSFRKPKRWEVAVFRCPTDNSTPYVKRVIGLPGEAIQIGSGDIYANGEILRKTPEQFREARVPIFNMDYEPPGSWNVRWLKEPWDIQPKLPRVGPAPMGTVANEKDLQDRKLILNASATRNTIASFTYRNFNLDTKTEDPIRDTLPYNGGHGSGGGPLPVHDFAITFDLSLVDGSGLFVLRLTDGKDMVSVTLTADCEGGATIVAEGATPVGNPKLRLDIGRVYRIEAGLVDRRAWVLVDGKLAMPYLDLPADRTQLNQRGFVTRPVQLGAQGLSAQVSHFKIDRDTHYRPDGPHAADTPYQLGPTEYFMMGDNSGNSKDSRSWAIPGVPEQDFLGKPFIIHQPLRLGRMTVNGEEHQYQTVDWSRLRWVR